MSRRDAEELGREAEKADVEFEAPDPGIPGHDDIADEGNPGHDDIADDGNLGRHRRRGVR